MCIAAPPRELMTRITQLEAKVAYQAKELADKVGI